MADDKATTPAGAAAAAVQNNVTPDSSTAQLAGAQPTTSSKKNKKKKKKAKAAAAGSDEPAEDKPAETPAEVKEEAAEEVSATGAAAEASEAEEKPEGEKVEQKLEEEQPAGNEASPTPTDVPGGFPITPALAAEQEKEASVSPLPAANGAVNPVKLEPGEEVPKATTEEVNTNVKLDKESYEKSDALPAEDLKDKPVGVDPLPAAAGAVNPVKLEAGEEVPKAVADEINKNVKLDKESYEKSDALPGSESLPPASNKTIPESSLPVTGAAEAAFLSSVGPDSTTAKLAGQVPVEPKAEKTLESEPQEKPAAAVPEPVKDSLEQSGKAPEAAASEEKVQEKKAVESEVKENVEMKPAETDTAAAVPEPVKGSIEESGQKPEAAANATAVGEKKEVEEELKKVVEAKTEAGPATEEGKASEAAPAKAEEAKPAEGATKAEEAKPAESAAKAEEAKPAESAAKAEEAKPAEGATKTEEAKPAEGAAKEEAKPSEPTKAEPAKPADKPAEGAAATNGAKANGTPAKKKKNRISSLFTKLKSKFSE
ncbi:hypothetical protein VUR80DRAFT_1372 [Thermomyces stellatus]